MIETRFILKVKDNIALLPYLLQNTQFPIYSLGGHVENMNPPKLFC